MLRPRLAGWAVADQRVKIITVQGVVGRLNGLLSPDDVVITGLPPTTSRLGRGARRLARAAGGRTLVVAVPHGGWSVAAADGGASCSRASGGVAREVDHLIAPNPEGGHITPPSV